MDARQLVIWCTLDSLLIDNFTRGQSNTLKTKRKLEHSIDLNRIWGVDLKPERKHVIRSSSMRSSSTLKISWSSTRKDKLKQREKISFSKIIWTIELKRKQKRKFRKMLKESSCSERTTSMIGLNLLTLRRMRDSWRYWIQLINILKSLERR